MSVVYPTFRKYFAAAAALAAIAVTAPAHAVTVVGAASITVKSALPDFIQVAELLAFDFDGDNVALASAGATATALSQYYPEAAPEGGPKEAIDGIYPAAYDYAHNPAIGGVYHSGGAGSNEFLTVTFAAPVTLARIGIYGRLVEAPSRDLYDVTIQNAAGATLWSGRLDARTAGSAFVEFDQPAVVPSPAPEPTGWAMMILGFGGAGAILRRRPGAARVLPA